MTDHTDKAHKERTDKGQFTKGNGGRPKGALNKENKLLREMILEALDKKGGAEYLAEKAESHPQAFMALLGRVLPLQVTGEGGAPMKITVVTGVPEPDGG